jgi:RimJ/RimL family protein N-acetyltransferase
MHLQTERLQVRDLTEADLDAVHALLDIDLRMDDRSRPDRARWLDWTILDYEQRRRAHQPPYGEYAVEFTQTGQVVGLVGLVPALMPFGIMPHHPAHGLDEAPAHSFPEVGLFWAISTAHQRRGYASEAAAALIGFGFGTMQLARIVATTEYANAASIAVMRRLAMRVDRNPLPGPFYLQVVGIIENPDRQPSWPARPWSTPHY